MLQKDPKAKGIRFEAFHVFKFYVANPNKPQHIVDLLLKNRDPLLGALDHMATNDGIDYGKELPLLRRKLIKL